MSPLSLAFQSAPAIAGGRCAVACAPARRLASFNPRPPLLAGDAPKGRCREERYRGFNPRPPLLAGDAWRHGVDDARRVVSIRARHCWRAMLTIKVAPVGQWEFQSAPAIAGGRCLRGCNQYVDPRLFQSAPAIAGGRCAGLPTMPPICAMFQSAPAIAGGRCLSPFNGDTGERGFNPRPPLLAGDARSHCRRDPSQQVSIRARHCWRAMLRRDIATGAGRQFQSAPAIAGGRCDQRAAQAAESAAFQSAPAIAGGRCPAAARSVCARGAVSIRARHCWRAMRRGANKGRSLAGFQSAPAIAGGRCVVERFGQTYRPVSIRARHCWRAMPAPPGAHPRAGRVSIRARHCWRAMRCSCALTRWPPRCFNPRPPLLAGDARGAAGSHGHVQRFQSAPAIAGGRCGY